MFAYKIFFHHFRSGKGGTVSSLMLTDISGTGEIVFFNNQIEKIKNVKSGQCVTFTNLKPPYVKEEKFLKGSMPFNLICQINTEVQIYSGDKYIPLIPFMDIAKIESKFGKKVNLVGIVAHASEPVSAGVYIKRDIVIHDAKNKVTVTSWNDNAKLPVELGKVIMIEQTMPKVYAGEICCSGGMIKTDHGYEEESEFNDVLLSSKNQTVHSLKYKVK